MRNFVVASEPCSTDNGMMTPTLKIRRHRVREAYGERLEALYRQPRPRAAAAN